MTTTNERVAEGPVFRAGRLLVIAEAMTTDLRPADFGPGPYSEPAIMESWRNREWQFCEPAVQIRWKDVVIATARGSAEPHGNMAGTYIDCLSKERREHGPAPILAPVRDAIRHARAWCATLGEPNVLSAELAQLSDLCDDFAR